MPWPDYTMYERMELGGRAPSMAEAVEFVRIIGILADGARELQKIVRVGALRVDRLISAHANTHAGVRFSSTQRLEDGVTLVVPIEGFPSEELKAQVMLVCG